MSKRVGTVVVSSNHSDKTFASFKNAYIEQRDGMIVVRHKLDKDDGFSENTPLGVFPLEWYSAMLANYEDKRKRSAKTAIEDENIVNRVRESRVKVQLPKLEGGNYED